MSRTTEPLPRPAVAEAVRLGGPRRRAPTPYRVPGGERPVPGVPDARGGAVLGAPGPDRAVVTR
ncbi:MULTISPECIES: hypothetical protein [unclassified Streptomyces]|uniref:hypothetical protein n=1 Tax=unclassified Streptomyces TaxID=2593676 RepID=UPI000CDACF51|nr:hypothetical protein [Streptomyces sp. SM10]